ncbi:MAG TPA: S46 family peptidase [Bacteroidales bacterium]|nr:S46 family peptidase [Bacteroidales bacterium]
MFKRSLIILVVFISSITTTLRADEGMWLPLFIERLNYTDMQKLGCRLTAEEIYSVNHSSLKDAIIRFGNGCTGEIISKEGLVLTNHHCGYGAIQANSSVEHDYLTDGFWAKSKEEELTNEGLTATFLIRIEDVTQKILAELSDTMSETTRDKKVEEIIAILKAEATKDTHYEASVSSFYDGNEYYLFVYEIFKDVRLVGAPPSSIGKFGGDTDNWMWPRHTGDFSMFRIYSAPDGKPAAYAKENIPLKPKHALPVSIKGYKPNDYAMIMGYPGTTDRFLTSYGVKLALEETNPSIVKIRDKKLELIKTDMDASDEIRIKYSSKYQGTSNYWKFFIGQSKTLKQLKIYDEKKAIEDEFTKWVNASETNKAKYGNALKEIETAYGEMTKYAKTRIYYTEGLMRGCEIISFAGRFENLYTELSKEKPDTAKIGKLKTSLKSTAKRFFKDFNAPTDQKLFAAMLTLMYNDIKASDHPSIFKSVIESKYKNDFEKYASDVFTKTLFSSLAKVEAFLAAPNKKILAKDPAFIAMLSVKKKFTEINTNYLTAYDLLSKGDRLFVAGIRKMNPDKNYSPNANGTMRLTYGKVLDYYPADAIHYEYFTTLKGVMDKEDPSVDEFVVPSKLKELYEKKDYGRYADNGEMKVCFLTDNDITGGNSGSPVINGNGELIGLAFDGNWEAMAGNIVYNPDLQRTINVDIRYVLFIIDKYAGATNLINELEIVEK